MHQQTRPSLVQIMTCRLIGTKPLSEPMLVLGLIGPAGTNFVKIWLKCGLFHSRKGIWKCQLLDGSHFVFIFELRAGSPSSNIRCLTHWSRDGCHFADDIFKCIFFNENILISLKIILQFVPKFPPTLAQIMAWRQPGDKPLSEPMMVDCWHIYPSLGLNELNSNLKMVCRN